MEESIGAPRNPTNGRTSRHEIAQQTNHDPRFLGIVFWLVEEPGSVRRVCDPRTRHTESEQLGIRRRCTLALLRQVDHYRGPGADVSGHPEMLRVYPSSTALGM